ncbi:hypothetical protein ACLHIL_08460 [Trueperella sp. LYQ143]
MMTLKVAGKTVFDNNDRYIAQGFVKSGGSMPWWAHSDWLSWEGTHGLCAPALIG